MKQYKVVGDNVEIIEGKYAGTSYQYGRVKLIEDTKKDELALDFEYNVVGEDIQDTEFRTLIGDILVELIEEHLGKHQVVYTGGTD
jgi:hypothetical protein